MKRPYYEPRPYDTTLGFSEILDFAAHLHKEVEMVYMLSGSSKASVDGNVYDIQAGDIFLVFPNKIHMYFESKDVKYLICIISPDELPDCTSLFKRFQPECPVLRYDEYSGGMIERMIEIIGDGIRQKTDRGIMLNCIRAFFDMLIEKMRLMPLKKSDGTLVGDVYNYVQENYCNAVTIESLAKHFHISNGYAAHIFSDKLKIGLRKYINALRVNKACDLLKGSEMSVTEIAYACGFDTIRTFNRVFLKEMGVSPRVYRNT